MFPRSQLANRAYSGAAYALLFLSLLAKELWSDRTVKTTTYMAIATVLVLSCAPVAAQELKPEITSPAATPIKPSPQIVTVLKKYLGDKVTEDFYKIERGDANHTKTIKMKVQTFQYETETGEVVSFPEKVKGVTDSRPFRQRHPVILNSAIVAKIMAPIVGACAQVGTWFNSR